MKIIVACDHGGYEMKKALIPFIEELGGSVTDIGCDSLNSVDYPDFAFPLAERVAAGEFDYGLLLCTTGVGMSICANKVAGARCALCCDLVTAELTRKHNDSNILALGAKTVGLEMAKSIVKTFLLTDFEGGRHVNRVNKITDFEGK